MFFIISATMQLPSGLMAQDNITLKITGDFAFYSIPYQDDTHTGYVTVVLQESFVAELEITVSVLGDITPWISWQDTTQFLLSEGESRTVHYSIDFPGEGPDNYTGFIGASYTVPDDPGSGTGNGGSTGTAAGVITTAMEIFLDVPSDLLITGVTADPDGAESEITNFGSAPFNGRVEYALMSGTSPVQTSNRPVSGLATGASFSSSVTWDSQLQPGETYDVVITVYDTNGERVNDKSTTTRVPSPADILRIERLPGSDELIYVDNTVSIYAQVRNESSNVTLHYQATSGAEQTEFMVKNPNIGYFVAQIPPQAAGDVEFWVISSFQGLTEESKRETYQVFPTTIPDLRVSKREASGGGTEDAITVTTVQEDNLVDVEVTLENFALGDSGSFVVTLVRRYRRGQLTSTGAQCPRPVPIILTSSWTRPRRLTRPSRTTTG
jgi:hypothetical protein